jgi:hypothetical protein
MQHSVVLLTFALLAPACIAGPGPRPDQLYAPGPQPLGPAQVSTLTGYVQFVDNKDVSSLGGYFELLPGCHVIGTPSHWGERSVGGNAVVTATTGRWTFALPMKAGHQYRIEVRSGTMMASTVPLTIKGYESDLAGNQKREFERATSLKDIDACFNPPVGAIHESPLQPIADQSETSVGHRFSVLKDPDLRSGGGTVVKTTHARAPHKEGSSARQSRGFTGNSTRSVL